MTIQRQLAVTLNNTCLATASWRVGRNQTHGVGGSVVASTETPQTSTWKGDISFVTTLQLSVTRKSIESAAWLSKLNKLTLNALGAYIKSEALLTNLDNTRWHEPATSQAKVYPNGVFYYCSLLEPSPIACFHSETPGTSCHDRRRTHGRLIEMNAKPNWSSGNRV